MPEALLDEASVEKEMCIRDRPTEYVVPLTRYTNGLILVTGSVGSGLSLIHIWQRTSSQTAASF